ncbi:hypothetical protein [uncultured Lactobacillus sp.]|uniref:hypothetical protein n=1 Tax=uncultured Lactobacillus sp. TaxID=153152 RepID=UPI00261ED455|nr:hypothetical protein [uncultured Lactobacillus sp.]
MHKDPKRRNIDLSHLQRKRLYHGLATINTDFAKAHADQIINFHTWDYGFWLKYLDLQRQALELTPIFEELDNQAEMQQYQLNMKVSWNLSQEQRQKQYQKNFNQAFEPIIKQIVKFWQEYPVTIYGSKIFLHGMAKTFFREKISFEEAKQGRQIKQTVKDLTSRNWDNLKTDLINYKGWWN